MVPMGPIAEIPTGEPWPPTMTDAEREESSDIFGLCTLCGGPIAARRWLFKSGTVARVSGACLDCGMAL